MMSDDCSWGDQHKIEIVEDVASDSEKDSEGDRFEFDDEEEIKNCYVKMIDFSNIVELKEMLINWNGIEV